MAEVQPGSFLYDHHPFFSIFSSDRNLSFMILQKKGSLHWLQFELLTEIPGLVHGVFSRQGGVSEAPFHSLNAALSKGDAVEAIQENRRRIKEAMNISFLVSMQQVHGADVALVENKELPPPICDALMTGKRDLGLMALHGDCQAAIFYDPIYKALAVVHAGWRGQVQNIYKACIQKMGSHFGSRPQDLLVGISPSLGPLHAEFLNYKREFPEEFWSFQDAFHHFNLWELARYQLERCGVLPHHIEIAEVCTYIHSADYFSYRRDKVTGRNATVAGLCQIS
jgi:polyphenol oxidase